MKINKIDLIKQEGYQDMPEKDAMRLLKSRYIIEDLGMNQLEYEPRKKVDDFDWSYYQPLAEVRKHLGSQWKQKLDEKFKVEIVQFEDDEDDYIDAEPKLEEQQPAAPAQVIETQVQMQNNININANTVILIQNANDIWFNSDGYFSIARLSNNMLRKTLAKHPNKFLLREVINILAENMSQNGFIKDRVTAEWLVKHADGFIGKRNVKAVKPIHVLEEMDILATNENGQVMMNPKVTICVGVNENNMKELEKMYEDFKSSGKFNAYFKGQIPQGVH